MFKPLPDSGAREVRVVISGAEVKVPHTFSAAAAVLAYGGGVARTTVVTGAPRAPYCLMGVCFDCLMEIDGVPNQQGCLVQVSEGMRIERQLGKRGVEI
jgi:hypothetical protein